MEILTNDKLLEQTLVPEKLITTSIFLVMRRKDGQTLFFLKRDVAK